MTTDLFYQPVLNWESFRYSLPKIHNCDPVMQLPTGTSFYGTGEVGGSVERTGKRVSSLFSTVFKFISCLLRFILTSMFWLRAFVEKDLISPLLGCLVDVYLFFSSADLFMEYRRVGLQPEHHLLISVSSMGVCNTSKWSGFWSVS